MLKNIVLSVLVMMFFNDCFGQKVKNPTAKKYPPQFVEQSQRMTIKQFPSKLVQPRNIEIYLPPSYATQPSKRYPVIYMHDGQNVFDNTTATFGTEWRLDETLDSLIKAGAIEEVIVVAAWSSNQRAGEYTPQKPESVAKSDTVIKFMKARNCVHQSDNYLKYLVTELKPYIDLVFRTKPDQPNTYLMGSSSGGLASMYATCEYPDVFGTALCLSTHWLVIDGAFLQYFEQALPAPSKNRFYFDFGTLTLDQNYEKYQVRADAILKAKGYTEKDWITKKFEGHSHSEASWSSRVYIPLIFALGKKK